MAHTRGRGLRPPLSASVSYHSSFRRCGKATCRTCSEGSGHGPYWYATWREGLAVRSAYMGRERPEPRRRTEFRVHCLGGLEVTLHDDTTVAWTKRPRELFTLLLSAPMGAVGREEIAESIWPDSNSLAAHQSVRATVTALRRLLGVSLWVKYEGPAVRLVLPPGSRDDVEFEAAARRALVTSDPDQIRTALALYVGTYLAHDRYSDWTTYRRQLLADLRRGLAMRAGMIAEQQRRPEEALGWLRALLADDSCDEAAARLSMTLHLAAGRRSEALRMYQALEGALRSELNVAPEIETIKLFAQAKAGAG